MAIAVADVPRETQRLEEIPLDLVDVGANVRLDAGELEELAASIVELGVLQPVKVTPTANGRYRLLWGQRRVLASRQAGKTTIPAIVDSEDDQLADAGARRSIEQLAENLQRKDLNPIEEAVALREVLDADKQLTQAALATRLGRSAPWVANTLGLLKAQPMVQAAVRDGTLSAAHAKALIGLPADEVKRLAERAIAGQLSAHDIEQNAKWYRERQGDTAKSQKRAVEAGARAVEALAAAKVDPATPVWVSAPWNVDAPTVVKAVEAAGYTIGSGYVGYGKTPKACDCAAVRVNVQDGNGTTVAKACVSRPHYEAEEIALREKRQADLKAQERDQVAIKKAVRARLEDAPPHPAVVRLLLRTLDSYAGDAWTEYAKKSHKAALDELANRVSLRHGTSYGRPVPAKTLLAALGVDEGPTPVNGKQAADA
jgi:ParB/RepB/Spo0J family partition protein